MAIETTAKARARHRPNAYDLRRRPRTCSQAPVNIDATVACEEPRLAPYRDEMESRLADALDLSAAAVNVKFTTAERMGFVGRGEGIAALAIATLA
jgi:2-C-methyl-D-erythritol 2,4-cyclodiphosphate synthase